MFCSGNLWRSKKWKDFHLPLHVSALSVFLVFLNLEVSDLKQKKSDRLRLSIGSTWAVNEKKLKTTRT